MSRRCGRMRPPSASAQPMWRPREPAQVLYHNRDYASVLAPFDGVITGRNVDVGTWARQRDKRTFMFTIMQSPSDAGLGLRATRRRIRMGPGGLSPSYSFPNPGAHFPGNGTRIAERCRLGTRTLLTRDRHSEPRR